MSNTYTWAIQSLTCVPQEQNKLNVVTAINCSVNGSDGVNNAGIYLKIPIKLDEKSSFTAFAKLTEQQIMGWIEKALGEDGVASIKTSLDNQLETLANPTVITPPLPWLA